MQDTFIIEQVNTFAVTIGLGLIIGLTYDILRGLKTVIRISRHVQFFIDFFYWLLMTMLVFTALLASNWGEVRAYVFIGLATGGIFYVLLFSRPWFALISRIFSLIAVTLHRLAKPIVMLLRKLSRLCLFFSHKLHGKAVRSRQAVGKIKRMFNRKKKE